MPVSPISMPRRDIMYAERILFALDTANMNVTTDQKFRKLYDFGDFFITRIRVLGASTSLTTAAGGIYPTTAKGGTAIVAAGQAYSALDASTKGIDLTVAQLGLLTGADIPYLSLTTAQGAAATARMFIMGVPVS